MNHDCPSGFMSWVLDEVGVFSNCKPMTRYDLRYDDNGDPLIEDCQKYGFWNFYSTPESASGFERLYTNTDQMEDNFLAYWDKVS